MCDERAQCCDHTLAVGFTAVTDVDTLIPYILKRGARGARTPQTILNFPQKDCSENVKSIKITLFAELLTVIFPIYVQSLK